MSATRKPGTRRRFPRMRLRRKVARHARLMPGCLCVSQGFAHEFNGRRVQVRLVGDRTALGFRIATFDHLPLSTELPQ